MRRYLPIHIGDSVFELALLYNYWPERLIKADLFILNYILFRDRDDFVMTEPKLMRPASGVILRANKAFDKSVSHPA